MKDTIKELLSVVIAACIPIFTAYASKTIKKIGEKVSSETNSASVKKHIQEITSAVSDAVSFTGQTYADELKEKGLFDKEAQIKAFNMSMNTAVSILSPTAVAFIEESYGDVNSFLTPKIEAAVRQQKCGYNTLLNE